MKKRFNWTVVSLIVNVVLILVLIVAVIGGRGGNYKKSADAYREYGYDESSSAWYGGYAEEPAMAEETEYEEDAEMNGYSKSASSADNDDDTVNVDEEAIKKGEKLVYSANISLETREYQAHKAQIFEVIKANGVVVESMSENTYDTTTHGSFTLRVPYDKYETVYNALCASDAGWAVRSASSQVTNMTKQYSKLTAQIEAYEQERATLLELLKSAENVSETLEIQDRLAWLNSDLQYYYNQREDIDADVLMSTIYLEMQEIKIYRPAQNEPYTFGERIRMAFQDGLDTFEGFCQDVALFFVEGWLFLGLLGILIVVIVIIVKKSRKRRMKKAAAEAAVSGPEEESETE